MAIATMVLLPLSIHFISSGRSSSNASNHALINVVVGMYLPPLHRASHTSLHIVFASPSPPPVAPNDMMRALILQCPRFVPCATTVIDVHSVEFTRLFAAACYWALQPCSSSSSPQRNRTFRCVCVCLACACALRLAALCSTTFAIPSHRSAFSRIIQSIHAMVGLAAIIFLLTNHVLAVVISGGASRLNFKSSAHVWIGRISVMKYLRCLYFCLVSLQLHASRSHVNHSKHVFKSITVHRFLIFRRVLSYAIFMSVYATPDAVAQAVLLAAATCTRALCITYAHASSPALHFQSTATCMLSPVSSLQTPHPPPPTSSWLDLHQMGRPHIRRHRSLPRRCPSPPHTKHLNHAFTSLPHASSVYRRMRTGHGTHHHHIPPATCQGQIRETSARGVGQEE